MKAPLLAGSGLPIHVRLSLDAVLIVAVPLMLRCISHGVWVTVVATSMLAGGAIAAMRGRTWGIGLTLLAGTAFPAAYFLGMAPSWFIFVGLVGGVPAALTWKPMVSFDRPAAKLFVTLAMIGGIACAITWHEIGWWVVTHLYP